MGLISSCVNALQMREIQGRVGGVGLPAGPEVREGQRTGAADRQLFAGERFIEVEQHQGQRHHGRSLSRFIG